MMEGRETGRRSLDISVKSLRDIATSKFGSLPGSGEHPDGSRILIVP